MQQALLELKGPSIRQRSHQHVPPVINRNVQRRSAVCSSVKADRAPATSCDDVQADVVIIGGGKKRLHEKACDLNKLVQLLSRLKCSLPQGLLDFVQLTPS